MKKCLKIVGLALDSLSIATFIVGMILFSRNNISFIQLISAIVIGSIIGIIIGTTMWIIGSRFNH